MSARFVIRKSPDGEFYLSLVAGNNEIQFHTEGFTRLSDAERAIEDIHNNVNAAFSHAMTEAANGRPVAEVIEG